MSERSNPNSYIQPETTVPSDESDEDVSRWGAGSILSSTIFQGRVQDGRLYAIYGKEEYGFPMDEEELLRIDLCHAKYYALLDKKRFLAPIPSHPQSVLDLGCGTGIWAIDFADMYPSAEVLGIDISPIQPHWVPPNCRFEINDMAQPWIWPEDSFDFIFARDLILTVRDYPKLIDEIYTHLKPGGWVEFQSIVGILGCDDGTLPRDGTLQKMSDMVGEACAALGAPVDDPLRWRDLLAARGFEAVEQRVLKVPCNPWPRDERLKLVGAFEMDNLLTNLEGLCLRPFRRAFGMSVAEINAFLLRAKREVRNVRYHSYWPFYITYARKPLHSTRS